MNPRLETVCGAGTVAPTGKCSNACGTRPAQCSSETLRWQGTLIIGWISWRKCTAVVVTARVPRVKCPFGLHCWKERTTSSLACSQPSPRRGILCILLCIASADFLFKKCIYSWANFHATQTQLVSTLHSAYFLTAFSNRHGSCNKSHIFLINEETWVL